MSHGTPYCGHDSMTGSPRFRCLRTGRAYRTSDPQNPSPTKLQPLGDLIIFTPHTLLDSGRTYDVLIEGFDDQTNRTMVPFSFSFTVADEIDLDPPVVEMVSPTGLNTPVNVVPAVRFSEPLDTTSLTQLGISAPEPSGCQFPVSSARTTAQRTSVRTKIAAGQPALDPGRRSSRSGGEPVVGAVSNSVRHRFAHRQFGS